MIKLAKLPLLTLLFIAQPAYGQQVVWSDEFNSGELDRKIWTHDVGGHGFGNGQLEFNTARPENAYVKDGRLFIEARRENYRGKSFTSARIHTHGRFAFKYGTLKARIKVPDTADGLWPAFWMLGDNFPATDWPKCGEVDILEIGGKEGITQGLQRRRINCALHFSNAAEIKQSLVEWHTAKEDLNSDFHVYSISWTPQRMTFFLDGQQIADWDISLPHFREYHQPFHPILNIAVGSWTSSYTAVDTPEKVTARFPAAMEVDWIRLHANPHTKVVLGAERRLPAGGFGVFSETQSVATNVKFADHTQPEFPYSQGAARFLWNNMTDRPQATEPAEGQRVWNWDIKAGQWFGMGVFLPSYRNLSRYAQGTLHFDIRTRSKAKLRVGIKSSVGSESWLPLGDENGQLGFPRDGQWHTVKVPLSNFKGLDFATVHQPFMLAGDAPTAPLVLAVDNVWWQD